MATLPSRSHCRSCRRLFIRRARYARGVVPSALREKLFPDRQRVVGIPGIDSDRFPQLNVVEPAKLMAALRGVRCDGAPEPEHLSGETTHRRLAGAHERSQFFASDPTARHVLLLIFAPADPAPRAVAGGPS